MSWYEIVQKQCIDIVSNVSPLKRREPSYTVVMQIGTATMEFLKELKVELLCVHTKSLQSCSTI